MGQPLPDQRLARPLEWRLRTGSQRAGDTAGRSLGSTPEFRVAGGPDTADATGR